MVSDLRRWLGPVHIVFSGGEALMKPFTTDLAAHAVSEGLFLEVLTHGYWEDQSKIERLARTKLWKVTISLDGLDGDVTVCTGADRIGNVKQQPIREMWEKRPKLWESGCCLEKRCSASELSATVPASSLHAASAWNAPSDPSHDSTVAEKQ